MDAWEGMPMGQLLMSGGSRIIVIIYFVMNVCPYFPTSDIHGCGSGIHANSGGCLPYQLVYKTHRLSEQIGLFCRM